MKAVVSEKGQVTIPKRLRDRLGICPGQVLDFEEGEDGRLVGRKVVEVDSIEEWFGTMDLGGLTTDEFLEQTRGPAELPPE